MFEKILPSETLNLLKGLKQGNLPSGSYLAGGTAVSLYFGHRRSKDLDFFTKEEFGEKQWESKLAGELNFKLARRDWQTLIGTAGGVKLSILGYPYKLIGSLGNIFNVPVASIEDLCAMKLDTVIGRSTKRDFVDIYFLGQKFGLPKMLGFYEKKFGNLDERIIMLKKGLIFFDDANLDENPYMLADFDWKEVKTWLRSQVK
jgi:hypothetical protein